MFADVRYVGKLVLDASLVMAKESYCLLTSAFCSCPMFFYFSFEFPPSSLSMVDLSTKRNNKN